MKDKEGELKKEKSKFVIFLKKIDKKIESIDMERFDKIFTLTIGIILFIFAIVVMIYAPFTWGDKNPNNDLSGEFFLVALFCFVFGGAMIMIPKD